MIPFPLMSGKSKQIIPPLETSVQQYTGSTYRGEDGILWTWDISLKEWKKQDPLPEDPGHPLHIMVGSAKIGTDGSFRRYVAGNGWMDIPRNVLTTDDGVNIGPLVERTFYRPYNAYADGWSDHILATLVPGRDDLYDLYVIGSRSDFVNDTGNKINAFLVAAGVKKDRIWYNAHNWVAEKDNGELWFQGMNFRNQYGPWKPGVSSSDQARQKINPWTKISDDLRGEDIKDVYVGAEMVIYAKTDGTFMSKGLNIGQFDDTSSSVTTVLTEIPATRFPSFKRFYQSAMTGTLSDPDAQITNCVWYLTDTGLRHFGANYGITSGDRNWPLAGTLQKAHSPVLGLPNRGDNPTFLWLPFGHEFSVGTYRYTMMAAWYDDPHEVFACSNSGLSTDTFEGATYLRKFVGSSSPAYKTRSLVLDFNRESTVIQGFDGKTYASGTSTVYNGLTVRTVPSSFVDQKMDSALFKQYSGVDWSTGPSQVLLKDGERLLVADANGSDFFGNGTKWKQTKRIFWQNYPDAKIDRVWTSRKFMYAFTQSRKWGAFIPDYTTVDMTTQSNMSGSDGVVSIGDGHLLVDLTGPTYRLGGNNIDGIFGTTNGWSDTNWNTVRGIGGSGTATASRGTFLSMSYDGAFWIFGKNYWEATQPVYPITGTSGTPQRWDQKPGFPGLPLFAKFIPAVLGYFDEGGILPQPYFLYRGTDGLFYSAGYNTTGCLGTGAAPATRDEARWTFEPVLGSEIFGNKNVRVYCGHGNSSALLFLCDGKMYGLGTPNKMKWDDQGTIADPFFPNFNKRLNKITYLMDMPDVMWTRPVEV